MTKETSKLICDSQMFRLDYIVMDNDVVFEISLPVKITKKQLVTKNMREYVDIFCFKSHAMNAGYFKNKNVKLGHVSVPFFYKRLRCQVFLKTILVNIFFNVILLNQSENEGLLT